MRRAACNNCRTILTNVCGVDCSIPGARSVGAVPGGGGAEGGSGSAGGLPAVEGDAKDNINAPWCDRILLHSEMRMVLALFEVSVLRVWVYGYQ